MGQLQLFDNNGDSSDDDLSKIEINHEFAKRLEHNKKREDLHRYEELKKQGRVDGSVSDDSSSEEEEEELLKPSKKTDSKFFDALIKVKNKDPILNNKDAKLFDSDSESESDSGSENEEKRVKKKKQKPMYLKDVVSKQLIEAGPEYDEEMENGDSDETEYKVKTYSEEQEEIRRKIVKALEDEEEENDEDGDLFKEKNNGIVDNEEDEEEREKLDIIFGEDGKLDEESKFLKDYFRHKMWIDNEKSKDTVNGEIEFSEDEEEIERQEDYEREFNFRFEENAGDRVMGHSRKVEGSVRKVEDARKSQRERKKERMKQAESERKEELKRLKNLKKKEINEKLEKIRKVAGIGNDGNIALDEDDLEEEFNPDEHDRKMKEAFGDEYYNAEDVNPAFGSDEDDDGLEKPDFDKEDELLGLPKDWDKVENYNEIGDDERKEGKRKRKRKPSEVEKAVGEELMEEYYKLDYEGTVGDLKTRFKYKPVTAKRFGLSPAELLMIDDKDLNQYVPLKKLAPYQEKGFKVDRMKTLQMKEKVKEIYTGETSKSANKHKKNEDSGEAATEVVARLEDDRASVKESGETSKASRRSRRRQGQNELKLSDSRKVAYGKIASKSKSKHQ